VVNDLEIKFLVLVGPIYEPAEYQILANLMMNVSVVKYY
jgi:hypothetical protein